MSEPDDPECWLPELRPGSQDPDLVAIHWAGQTWSYREFAARVNAAVCEPATITSAPTGGCVSATARAVRSIPEQLVALFAAAAGRRPIWIADPALGLPTGWKPPAGAFLVVGTSGTTQAPRAIVRTASSWTRSFPGYSDITGIARGDRVLLTGPLHSTLHLFAAVHALAIGAAVTDDPIRADSAICVPAVLPRFSQRPHSLRSVVVAGAPLPMSIAEPAMNAGLTVIEYYGAAELSFVTARRWPAPHRPFPGVTMQLRKGMIWSRSPYQALGRLSADGFTALPRDEAGFACVGDLAAVDTAGGLRIVGRGSAAVSVGGRTVIAEEVEAALTGLASVVDAVVVGLPHPRLGEQLCAVVVLGEGAALADVRGAARSVLPGESLPQRWLTLQQLPLLPSGKIDRSAARKLLSTTRGPQHPQL